MSKNIRIIKYTKKAPLFLTLILGFLCVLAGTLLHTPVVSAVSASSFKAGNIISDSVFTDKNSMGTSQIQSFLNSKVPSCDSSGSQSLDSSFSASGVPDYNSNGYIQRWEWAKYHYGQTTFKCLRDYTQSGHTAAWIINDAAKDYSINPKVLIVLLQKEQGLVTDTWPLNLQYKTATGYGCPDTAACDSDYFGFTNQVRWAARMFRAIIDNSPTWYTPYVLGNNSIPWNPNTGSCGYSTVNIQNRATQALYNYTPYRPNSAALNTGYGSGNSCSSYGNRNFWLYFNDWFGSTNAAYDSSIVSVEAFSDAGMTNPLDVDNLSIGSNSTIYVRVVANNSGYNTWSNSFVKLAPTNRRDRTNSAFYDTSWNATSRVTSLKEPSVDGGEQGTFEFALKAPNDIGNFTEDFGLVAEHHAWMDSEKVSLDITVAPSASYATHVVKTEAFSDSGRTKSLGSNIRVKPDTLLYVRTTIKNIGSQTLDQSFTKLGTVSPRDRTDSAFYDSSWVATNRVAMLSETTLASGSSGTFDYVMLMPSTDGVYTEDFGTVATGHNWMDTEKVTFSVKVSSVVDTLQTNSRLYEGDLIRSRNGDHRLVLQGDGNLVLYTKDGKVLWTTKTNGTPNTNLVMQGDGNLVLYGDGGKVLWRSATNSNGASRLVMQNDGNLVIYASGGRSVWASHTRG